MDLRKHSAARLLQKRVVRGFVRLAAILMLNSRREGSQRSGSQNNEANEQDRLLNNFSEVESDNDLPDVVAYEFPLSNHALQQL